MDTFTRDKIHTDMVKVLHQYVCAWGERRKELTGQGHMDVVTRCDGFGRMTAQQLRELGIEWDWSHVRDSSDEAIEEAYQVLMTILEEIKAPSSRLCNSYSAQSIDREIKALLQKASETYGQEVKKIDHMIEIFGNPTKQVRLTVVFEIEGRQVRTSRAL